MPGPALQTAWGSLASALIRDLPIEGFGLSEFWAASFIRRPAMHLRSSLLFLVLLLSTSVRAQEVSFFGFVKSETIHDTRQVAQVREGQFLLYPLAAVDANQDGHDDNAHSNLLMAAFQSRIGVQGSEVSIAGGQVSALLEADFFGQNDAAVSMLRLRLANVKWSRGSHALLAGQTWSPLFTAGLHPGVVGFATGAPFQPFARFPQIRYTWRPGSTTVLLAASTQRDAFQDIGGSKMQQQSGQPALHLHMEREFNRVILGAGATTKKILCELEGPSFRANAATIYGRWAGEKTSITIKAVRGEDLTDHLMTGGFLATTEGAVVPIRVQTVWADVDRQISGRLSAGIFAGYLSNLGVGEDGIAAAELFTRAHDLASLLRIAPRLSYQESALRVAFEIEYSSARYADIMDDSFRPVVDDARPRVGNVRSLLAVYYHF